MRGTTQHFLQRHRWLFALLGIVLVGIFLQLLTIIYTSSIQAKGIQQTHKTITFNTDRGEIYDRNGSTIAGNIITNTLIINPQNVYLPGTNNVESVWKLSPIYQKKKNTTLTHMIQTGEFDTSHIQPFNVLKFIDSLIPINHTQLVTKIQRYQEQCLNTNLCDRYHVLAKKLNILSDEVATINVFKQEKFLVCSKVKELPSKFERFIGLLIDTPTKYRTSCKKVKDNALHFEHHAKRIYPFSPSTTPSIGALNYKHQGVYGLESTYEHYLQHTKRSSSIQKTPQTHINYYDMSLKNTLERQDLQLTLDNTVQFYLYDAIANAVEKFQAQSGSGIIINPNGEILAMVSYPTNDVNLGISGTSTFYLNRVLTDNLEIASTIKPLITTALLEQRLIALDEIISFTREETKEQRTHYDTLSIAQIIEKSYTPGSIKITSRMDDATLHHYLTKFGFNQSTNVLPNIENTGYLQDIYSWDESSRETLSYGYGMSATLAQLARAYTVFANNGVLSNLTLLPQSEKSHTQVVSSESVTQMLPVLERVVTHGTAKKARPDFHSALGKTGTARLLIDGSYTKNRTNAFFIGMAPLKNIQYIMAVVINDPISDISREGGYVSAPIFKQVMDNILE